MATPAAPTRLFLDAGVIIDGVFSRWGTCKALLIHATIRANYIVVLAEAIEREVHRGIARRAASLAPDTAKVLEDDLAGWLRRIRTERHPYPTKDQIERSKPVILPVLRHGNDLPAVVTAMLARPDWVISTNTEHWNEALAARTGLRIATPLAFLSSLRAQEQK